MAPMAQPWKHPQNGIYYFRREVPADIRSLIGKREWKVSLKTRSPQEARPRFAAESLKCEEAFAAARDQLAGRPRLLSADAPKLADRWARKVMEEWETAPEKLLDFLAEVEEGGSRYYVSAVDVVDTDSPSIRAQVTADIIRSSLASEGLPLPPEEDHVREVLESTFFSRWCDLCAMAYSRHTGDWRSQLSLPAADKPLTAEVSKQATKKLPTLSVAFEEWAQSKRLDKSSDKTIAEFTMVITRFIELFGDLPLNEITRSLCFDFREALLKIPVKGRGIRGLTAPGAIARAEAEGLETASPATARKQLRGLSAVLGYAMRRHEAMTEDPVAASGVISDLSRRIQRNKAIEAEEEKEYTRQELQAIFNSPLFVEGWKPPVSDFGEALYWLPLLMAYTGARREELAQMHVADVQQDEPSGIWFLYIRPGEDKSLKTLSSRRKVPLHDDLLALGFLEYVQTLEPTGRLFPKLKKHKSNGYGYAVGKAWARYVREVVKLDTQASPSHGFRHSFKTICRDVGIPKEVSDWLTGHSSGEVGDAYGSAPLARMARELKKFPNVAGK